MRAVLFVVVLMTALWCVAGAVGLTAYLAAVGVRVIWDRRRGFERVTSPPGRGVVLLLSGYAGVMVAVAGAMVWAREPFWVAMASWSALAAVAVATVHRRRGSRSARSGVWDSPA